MNRKTMLKVLILKLFLVIFISVRAEVILDGTLGRIDTLSGPDYQIKAELGQQLGNNLFHSFRDFNLQSHETSIFSGPNTVQNIITRITGGNPSMIDGTIRSTIPNANMYFLNPFGILFGPHAKLDVQGDFHASTADYLRLQDGGRFDAYHPSDSLLTVASVETFGFLTNTPSKITIQDSSLSVPDSKTFSLIGGNLRLSGQFPVQFDENGFAATDAHSKLNARGGQINLISNATKGEINVHDLESNQGGSIEISNVLLETSHLGGGSIFIRGGQLSMYNAVLQANTLADQDGKGINLKLNDSIHINGDLIAISSGTFGRGKAGNLLIKTPILETNGSYIDTSSTSGGDGGDVSIESERIILKNGAGIGSRVFNGGNAGRITIAAKDSVSLEGFRPGSMMLKGLKLVDYATELSTTANGPGKAGEIKITTGKLNMKIAAIAADAFGKGSNSNEINIQANAISLTEGSLIIVSLNNSDGKPGRINLNVDGTLYIAGQRPVSFISPRGEDFGKGRSGIGAPSLNSYSNINEVGHIMISADSIILEDKGGISTQTAGKGDAGHIEIKVKDLVLNTGGQIGSDNQILFSEKYQFIGEGNSGEINIIATGKITITGQSYFQQSTFTSNIKSSILTNTASSGQGGKIVISADSLIITEGATITASSKNIGNAGEISLTANTIHLITGEITTEAQKAGGGNININIPSILYLKGGKITTSVKGGIGKGGNITIETPQFIVLNQGQIKAQAAEGQGGNISIISNNFIASPNSIVSASSQLGIDGEIKINSFNKDVSSLFITSVYPLLNKEINTPCKKYRSKEPSHFYVYPIRGQPLSPEGWYSIPIPETYH